MNERELLCVRVATLLRNKYASKSKNDVIQHVVKIVLIFYFIVLDIFLAFTTAQAKKTKKKPKKKTLLWP